MKKETFLLQRQKAPLCALNMQHQPQHATWEFNRQEFPSTVHGLMSLWGGFDAPSSVTDSGCEKRLELDLAVSDSSSRGLLSMEEWKQLFEIIGEDVVHTMETEALNCLRTPNCVLIVQRDKVIVTGSAHILLHELVNPLIDACSPFGTVEWTSFMRKNVASPWDLTNGVNHVMAGEYAVLKHAFPHGKSFLIGPVDGDHYFYFVHDAVNRKSGGSLENDVQVNLVMYNVHEKTEEEEVEGKRQNIQRCELLSNKGEYEVFRHFDACGQRCVTFETNMHSEEHASRISQLLNEYQPDRCTLITLFDPATSVACRLAKGDRCGLDRFEGYSTENRFTNEFAHGYIVRKTMFVRSL